MRSSCDSSSPSFACEDHRGSSRLGGCTQSHALVRRAGLDAAERTPAARRDQGHDRRRACHLALDRASHDRRVLERHRVFVRHDTPPVDIRDTEGPRPRTEYFWRSRSGRIPARDELDGVTHGACALGREPTRHQQQAHQHDCPGSHRVRVARSTSSRGDVLIRSGHRTSDLASRHRASEEAHRPAGLDEEGALAIVGVADHEQRREKRSSTGESSSALCLVPAPRFVGSLACGISWGLVAGPDTRLRARCRRRSPARWDGAPLAVVPRARGAARGARVDEARGALAAGQLLSGAGASARGSRGRGRPLAEACRDHARGQGRCALPRWCAGRHGGRLRGRCRANGGERAPCGGEPRHVAGERRARGRRALHGTFADALATAASRFDFATIVAQREDFRDELERTVGTDLSGYRLERVTLERLARTPNAVRDPRDASEARSRDVSA